MDPMSATPVTAKSKPTRRSMLEAFCVNTAARGCSAAEAGADDAFHLAAPP